ncbi:uncharacterized protein LOC133732053 [Rosa rugosa]|uniref:uncharacterized protein LOC133732053 n=1 Tax=Rosa rugosa TaxID=74645 RepID=UPI002B406C2C|nr:uncharacterized protein LOC133732053 [Rosa rugosa]
MVKMWRIFRESGPPPEIPEHLYTMEIFHGGYFDKQLDGTKKYKVAREKPISYHFKLPRTSSNEGFIPIKNDADAIEMVKLIPLNKRQISVYITGGGPRQKREAELDDLKPDDPDWENPLNKCTTTEKEKMFEAANLLGSQLNRSPSRATVGTSVPEIIDLEDEGGSYGNEGETRVGEGLNVGREKGGLNVGVRPSQSTFAGLSDILPDVLGSQASIGQEGHRRKSGGTEGHKGNLGKATTKPKRVKHCIKRSWPASATAALNKKLEDIERREREAAEKAEKEGWEKAEREAAELRERQATVEEQEEAQRLRERDVAEQLAREEAEKREQEAAEKRARDVVAVREKLAEELRERLQQSQQSKKGKSKEAVVSDKGKKPVQAAKVNKSTKKPKDPRYNTRRKGSWNNARTEERVVKDDETNSGSDFYVDSDYDLEHDEFDDADFEENVTQPRVVEEFDDMGYGGYCSDDHGDSDDLESIEGSETEEDEDGNSLPNKINKGVKIRPWIRSVDLRNPKFRLGLTFPNSEQLKEAVRECAIRNQLGLWFENNSKHKIEVNCQWDCPFRLYASTSKGEGPTLIIRTLNNKHTCSPVEISHFLNYNRIAQEVQADLLVDENWSRVGIHNHIEKKYKLDVGVQTITRAKRKAKRMNESHYIDQYNNLAAYRKKLLRSNLGSTVDIKTCIDGDIRRFHRMYICFAACKNGWMNGCRPIIGLDGCHIKGHHPGQLLAAVGIDANNRMFPIAYAIAEAENQETWTWFLYLLKCDLKIERDSSYTFITDKQKGLGNAISGWFPNAEHRHCVRHLYNNFKAKHPGEGLKQLVWNAARSSTVVWFNKHMADLRELSEGAWSWFQDKNPAQWSRAYFKDESRCDLLLNNLCESFNAAILPARDKPILTMLEKIRMDMMVRQSNRRVACERWKDLVGPRTKKIIDKIG